MATRARFTVVAALAVFAVIASPGAGVSMAQPRQCGPQGQYQVNISFGDIGCSDAYAIAAAYNLTGEKYQDIGNFTCYTADSQTEPLIFQCVSGGVEFGVYWA